MREPDRPPLTGCRVMVAGQESGARVGISSLDLVVYV